MTPKKMEAHMAAIAARVSETRRKIETLEPELEDQEIIRDKAEGRLTEARGKIQKQDENEDRLAELRPRASELEGEIESAAAALADAKDETPVDGEFLPGRIEQGEKTIQAKRDYDLAVERFATYQETRAGHAADQERWNRVAKVLQPDGVEALYVERMLEPVRAAVERFGKRFGGMRLDLDYNVEWLWKDRWRRWHQLSASGRLRVAYAVQYAFASQKGFRLLVLDEIDHLDAAGKLAAIESSDEPGRLEREGSDQIGNRPDAGGPLPDRPRALAGRRGPGDPAPLRLESGLRDEGLGDGAIQDEAQALRPSATETAREGRPDRQSRRRRRPRGPIEENPMTAEIIETDEGRLLVVLQADTPTEAIAMRLFAESCSDEQALFTPAEPTPEGPGINAPRLVIRGRGGPPLIAYPGGRVDA
jgi:hypothetical protein